jgi:hypothetical protein
MTPWWWPVWVVATYPVTLVYVFLYLLGPK